MIAMRTAGFIALALLSCVMTGSSISAQNENEALARAKELYASAAYDEALAVLDRLKTASSRKEAVEIAGYRVFCLLALGRSDEATHVIEAILKVDPLYRPSEAETSPRTRSVFEEVKRRVLPEIVQESYNRGKAAFDRRDFAVARLEFDRVLELLDDPIVARVSGMNDLRTLASGFRDLSKATAESDASAPSTPAPVTAASGPRIYSTDDPGVVRPVPVSQQMPPWRPRTSAEARQAARGALELIIDEEGNVATAVVRESIHPAYDTALLQASRKWKYRPAMKAGVPVKYRELMAISLKPPS
jgi:TonB family protein